MPEPDLSISIATWNNRDLVADCLRSIEANRADLALEMFVVDNASTDGTAALVRERFPGARLIENAWPLGFSANHNQVLRQAAGRFVLLLNDDTIVPGDALRQAVRFLEAHADVGAVGCTLLRPDGTPERIAQRFPHPLDPFFPGLRAKTTEDDEAAEAVEVERWSGAALIVRRAVLERIGLLDERFDPAYGEDTDLCYRIRQAGWRICRLPRARIVHLRGRTARREFGAEQARRLQEAKFRWYGKHRGRGARLLYRTSVAAVSLAQIAAGVALLALPHRRSEAGVRVRRAGARLAAALSPLSQNPLPHKSTKATKEELGFTNGTNLPQKGTRDAKEERRHAGAE